jgi:hypothetical protein
MAALAACPALRIFPDRIPMKSFLTTAAFASLLGLLPAAAQAQDARDQFFATLKSSVRPAV